MSSSLSRRPTRRAMGLWLGLCFLSACAAEIPATVTPSPAGATLRPVDGDACGKERQALAGMQAELPADAGTAADYYAAMKQAHPDPNALALAINADLQQEMRRRMQTTRVLMQLRTCRASVRDGIIQQRMAGQLRPPEAKPRLTANRGRMLEELAGAEAMLDAMGKRDQQFQAAVQRLRQDLEKAPAAVPAAQRSQRAAAVAVLRRLEVAVTETVPEKRSAFGQSVGMIRADSNMNVDWDGASRS